MTQIPVETSVNKSERSLLGFKKMYFKGKKRREDRIAKVHPTDRKDASGFKEKKTQYASVFSEVQAISVFRKQQNLGQASQRLKRL